MPVSAGQFIFYGRISVLDGVKYEPKFMKPKKRGSSTFFVLTNKVSHKLTLTIVLD